MAKLLFISSDYLKENSVVNLNVDDKILSMCIESSQDLYVQESIGTTLYNHLQTVIINSGSTGLTSYETTLLDDYLIPGLINQSIVAASVALSFKIQTKGVQQQNSENSTSVDSTSLEYMRSEYRKNAEFYFQRAIDYIKSYYNEFKDYYNVGSDIDLKGVDTSYKCPIVLGGKSYGSKEDFYHDSDC